MDQHIRGLFKARQPEIFFKELAGKRQRDSHRGRGFSLFRPLYGRQEIRAEACGGPQPYRDDYREAGRSAST